MAAASTGSARTPAADAFAKTGEYIPRALYESLESTRVGLKGPVTTPIGGGFASINVTPAQEV